MRRGEEGRGEERTGEDRRGEERREQRGEDRRRDERKREVAKVQGEWLDVARPDVAKAHTRTDRNMHTHLNTHVFLETIHPQTHTDFLPPVYFNLLQPFPPYTSVYHCCRLRRSVYCFKTPISSSSPSASTTTRCLFTVRLWIVDRLVHLAKAMQDKTAYSCAMLTPCCKTRLSLSLSLPLSFLLSPSLFLTLSLSLPPRVCRPVSTVSWIWTVVIDMLLKAGKSSKTKEGKGRGDESCPPLCCTLQRQCQHCSWVLLCYD